MKSNRKDANVQVELNEPDILEPPQNNADVTACYQKRLHHPPDYLHVDNIITGLEKT